MAMALRLVSVYILDTKDRDPAACLNPKKLTLEGERRETVDPQVLSTHRASQADWVLESIRKESSQRKKLTRCHSRGGA